MKNFAISAKDEIADRGQEVLEKLRANDRETKADLFEKMLNLVETKIENNEMETNGIDTEALDASLSNIRALFIAATSGRNELKSSYDKKMAELKLQKDEVEKTLQNRLMDAKDEIKTLQERASGATLLKETAFKNAAAAETKAQTLSDLAEELKKTNAKLQEELEAAQNQLESLDQTRNDLAEAKRKIKEMEMTLQSKKETYSASLAANEENYQMRLDMEKEKNKYAIEKAVNEAVHQKETEMMDQIREMHRKIAVLEEQVKNKIYIELCCCKIIS